MIVLGVLAGLVLAPSAFAADPTPADFKNAAKYCKAVRESKGVEAFQAQYGTNKNKRNAYGKCVSATAEAKAEKRADTPKSNEATSDCKKQKAEDAAKFATQYKNFGQCIKAKNSTT
jgi:hypothetical protein